MTRCPFCAFRVAVSGFLRAMTVGFLVAGLACGEVPQPAATVVSDEAGVGACPGAAPGTWAVVKIRNGGDRMYAVRGRCAHPILSLQTYRDLGSPSVAYVTQGDFNACFELCRSIDGSDRPLLKEECCASVYEFTGGMLRPYPDAETYCACAGVHCTPGHNDYAPIFGHATRALLTRLSRTAGFPAQTDPLFCRPAATECTRGSLKVCHPGCDWIEVGCASGRCADDGRQCFVPVCTPNASLCSDSTRTTCNADGSGSVSETCDFGCAGDGRSCCRCSAGEAACAGGRRTICNADCLSESNETCAHGCADDGETCRECTPGSQSCSNGTKTLCSDDGVLSEEQCETGNCDAQGRECASFVCQPSDSRCDADGVSTCLSDGSGFGPAVPCETNACADENVCAEAACEVDETSCDAGWLATCLPDRTGWTTPVECETRTCRDGSACASRVCEPSAPGCESGIARTCNPTGTAWVPGEPCESGQCAGDACAPSEPPPDPVEPPQPPPAGELLANGDFEAADLVGWGLPNARPGATTIAKASEGCHAGSGCLAVANAQPDFHWTARAEQPVRGGVVAGNAYLVNLCGRSDDRDDVYVEVARTGPAWQSVGAWERIPLERTMRCSGFVFTATASAADAVFILHLGATRHPLILDDISMRDLGVPPTPNGLLLNGDFGEMGTLGWTREIHNYGSVTMLLDSDEVSSAPFSLRIVNEIVQLHYQVQANQAGLSVEQGACYRVSFAAKGEFQRETFAELGKATADWRNYGLFTRFVLTTEWEPFEVLFRANVTADDARLGFQAGTQTIVFWLDDVAMEAAEGCP